VTLITLAFCEKEGIVGVTGLEILGVSTGFDDVASDDDLPEAPMAGDSLKAFSNGCSELDFPLGRSDEIEEDDASGELILLTFSLRTCSNGSSSEW